MGETIEPTAAEHDDLRAALKARHEAWAKAQPRGRITMRAVCVCGYRDTPGPPACALLRKPGG